MTSALIELRNELITQLEGTPGFRSVGLVKSRGKPVFVVSVDPDEFRGGTPLSFHGYAVEVKNLGRPVGHVAEETVH